jgi:hypothetical protein
MEKIDIDSTSSHSAICSDIVLRTGERVRLIFRPEIVDNAANPEARYAEDSFISERATRAHGSRLKKYPSRLSRKAKAIN